MLLVEYRYAHLKYVVILRSRMFVISVTLTHLIYNNLCKQKRTAYVTIRIDASVEG